MPLPALFAVGTLGTLFATFAKYFIASAIIRVVSAFGIGLVTFAGADLITAKVVAILNTLLFKGNESITAALAAGGIFDAVNIILSAYIAVFTIKATMGVFNRVTFGRGA